MSASPLVSVVIPTYNRLERLKRVLNAFEAQTCAPDAFEVVVVSDGSTDGTDHHLATATHGFSLTTATQANAGPAAARNHGVELARAGLVLFVDDDVVATPTLVERHLAAHHRLGPDHVVIGPMNTPPDFTMTPWVQWEQAMLYKQYDALRSGRLQVTHRQFYTGNASVSRARLLEAGGFDTRFRRAEDVELSFRLHLAGLRFAYADDAVGYHYAERSFDSWLRNAHAYGVNEVVFGVGEGQDPKLLRVHAEYGGRHPLVRVMARLVTTVPAAARVLDPVFTALAGAADRAGAHRANRFALSALFNMAYYRGMAGELGGASAFRHVVVRADDRVVPTPRRSAS